MIDILNPSVYTDTERSDHMVSEAQKRAVKKYDENNTVSWFLKLNLNTDADIIEYMKKVPSRQGLIKQLIREHMRKEDS